MPLFKNGGDYIKWDNVLSFSTVLCGVIINYLWGGLDIILNTLLFFMVTDYISGLICGMVENKLSSKVGFRGLLKKIAILIIIAVGFRVDNIVNAQGSIRAMVISFYIALEGISILENSARIGVPIPDKLKNMLIQIKDKGDIIE